jgi:hypothetical protein
VTEISDTGATRSDYLLKPMPVIVRAVDLTAQVTPPLALLAEEPLNNYINACSPQTPHNNSKRADRFFRERFNDWFGNGLANNKKLHLLIAARVKYGSFVQPPNTISRFFSQIHQ